ncbi:ABC transporter ATP-binding protein [Anaerocolumna sp. AGMB13020]|uniref:ABC transporter ATP-binding protein n=1 Tax=Anaerocolumna sp. AGMB13020 TaxID=3081750 RepID=UPI0029559515|nr:ABC transporter ATP-binding protein [Anaerocolumna sp. AGMB13020]WOO34794.1 ABC transporter ATP-binding protein [Anaerocolumna sp. AGMB13020]
MKVKHFLNELYKMISLLKEMKWIYFFALFLSCTINVTSNVLSAFVNKNMIKTVETGDMHFLFSGFVLAIIAFLIGIILFPFCIYLKVSVIKKAMAELKLKVFRQVVELPLSYHDSKHSGDLTSRMMNDINSIESSLNDDMQMAGVSLIGGICSAVLMLRMDFRLALITMVIGFLSAKANIAFSGSLRILGNKIQESYGVLNQYLIDITTGYRTTMIFNIGSIITGRYIRESQENASLNYKRVCKNSQLNGINYLSGVLSMTGVYVIGVLMVLSGQIELDTVVVIVGLQKGVNYMFLNIGKFRAQLQGAFAGASRISELLEEIPEPDRREGNSEVRNETECGEILLENVRFLYNGQDTLINNITLNIYKGSAVALTGVSGAGKSTIIKLLMGFYPLSSGNIYINNKSIDALSLKALRNQIAYVPQDAYLFNGTIEENIRYGKINATTEEIAEAAKKANAHHFIMKMPDAYDTMVGESGKKLSGGQRQCISIARAILKDAPILLLDEATSALDSNSEELVQKGLADVFKNKTALVVAHRLSTIERANEVYVLKKGKLAAAQKA